MMISDFPVGLIHKSVTLLNNRHDDDIDSNYYFIEHLIYVKNCDSLVQNRLKSCLIFE